MAAGSTIDETESSSPIDKRLVDSEFAVEDVSQYTTTRTELWSYYIYYIGNNGLSGLHNLFFFT